MFEGLLKLAEKTPFAKPAICEGKDVSSSSSSSSAGALLKDVCSTRTFGFAAANSGRQIEYGTREYFLMCSLGGILSCGITHTLICPLDMIKCRMQINKAKYPGMFSGLKVAVAEEGVRVLARGWAPTLFGYSAQGFFKFGLYEYFKKYYYEQFDEETAYLNRLFIFLGASATAEFIADIALSPFEATKVRIQTIPNYPSQMRKVMPLMVREEGYGAFFKSLVPLWCRQIPYTMMKFASFEKTIELLYLHVLQKPRAQATPSEELVTTFAGGYIAGVFCAVVSHPADTLVSKLNQDKGASARQIISNVGFGGLWAGLGTRIIMIGTLTGAQWLIYDGFKVYFNIPRPPPKEPPLSLMVKQKIKKITDEVKETAEDVRLRGKEFGSSMKGKTEHTAKDVKSRSKDAAEQAKIKAKDVGQKTEIRYNKAVHEYEESADSKRLAEESAREFKVKADKIVEKMNARTAAAAADLERRTNEISKKVKEDIEKASEVANRRGLKELEELKREQAKISEAIRQKRKAIDEDLRREADEAAEDLKHGRTRIQGTGSGMGETFNKTRGKVSEVYKEDLKKSREEAEIIRKRAAEILEEFEEKTAKIANDMKEKTAQAVEDFERRTNEMAVDVKTDSDKILEEMRAKMQEKKSKKN